MKTYSYMGNTGKQNNDRLTCVGAMPCLFGRRYQGYRCICNEVIHLSASVKWMPVWTWKHVHATHCKVVCTVSWHNGMLAPCHLLYASFQCRKIGSDESAGRLSGAVPWLHVDSSLLKHNMHTLYLHYSDHDMYQWNRQVQLCVPGSNWRTSRYMKPTKKETMSEM